MPLIERPFAGILFRIGAAACLVATGTCVKAAQTVPIGQAMFIRSAAALAFILLAALLRGRLRGIARTRSWRSHLGRGLIGASGIFFMFGAYTRLPITEVTTMLYASPFLIVAIGALFMRERVEITGWLAVVFGFVGVLIVAWPRITLLTSGELTAVGAVGLVFALGAICTNVAANLAVRQMVGTEGSDTIALYFALISAAAALTSLPFGWIVPSAADLALLIAAGLAGALGQIFLGEAFRNARMSVVAPFEYSSILFAVAAGIMLFSEWPGVHTLIGSAIVVASGIAVVLQQSVPKLPSRGPDSDS